jgi:hypothetical protein
MKKEQVNEVIDKFVKNGFKNESLKKIADCLVN